MTAIVSNQLPPFDPTLLTDEHLHLLETVSARWGDPIGQVYGYLLLISDTFDLPFAVGVGYRVAWARRRRGLRQSHLAAMLGVTRQAVHQWETGRTCPRFDHLRPLSEALEVNLNFLLGVYGRDLADLPGYQEAGR